MICRICGNGKANKEYLGREMILGTAEEFSYFECGSCGCLQITGIPEDMSRHYKSYYSQSESLCKLPSHPLKRALRLRRDRALLFGRDPIGQFLHKVRPTLGGVDRIDLLRRLCPGYSSKILDVGSGTGQFLSFLDAIGLRHLVGVDPYIDGDLTIGSGTRVLKGTTGRLTEQFDIIMLEWVLEHMEDQHYAMSEISRLLCDTGTCMLSIPIVPSYFWRRYGMSSVQIDVPRHLYMHSLRSIRLLATQYGLSIPDTVFRANSMSFWGSEQHIRGVSLSASNSHMVNTFESMFSQSQIRAYGRDVDELNRRGDSDVCTLYLKKNKGFVG